MTTLEKFKAIFYITLTIAVAFVVGDVHNVIVEATKLLKQTELSERSVTTDIHSSSVQLASVPPKVDSLVASLTSQLSKANGTLESASGLLLTQTGMLQHDLSTGEGQLGAVLLSLHKVVEDPSIPLLIRDSRRTVSLIGTTAAPIRQMAERIDQATPSLIASSVSVANSGAGIAKDVHKVADDFVKPKPWYKKLLGVTMDLAGLARFF